MQLDFVFDSGSEIWKNDSNFEIKASSVRYLFVHQSDQCSLEYPVGVMLEGGRWVGWDVHHATRQIGCDMDQHATLHPP